MNQLIRKAVGAIVIQNDECMLVHKVRISNELETTSGVWDFPKGGIEESENEEQAVLRELQEETGSNQYKVIKKFEEKICFQFNENIKRKTGYDQQETTMFLVKYLGNGSDLKPQDSEIDQIKFISIRDVPSKLAHHESIRYYKKYVLKNED